MLHSGDRVRTQLGYSGTVLADKLGTVVERAIGERYDYWVTVDDYESSGPYAFYADELEKVDG